MRSELKKRLLLSKWRGEQSRGRSETFRALMWNIEKFETALVDVKYWLHDGRFSHLSAMLRKVERTLSP